MKYVTDPSLFVLQYPSGRQSPGRVFHDDLKAFLIAHFHAFIRSLGRLVHRLIETETPISWWSPSQTGDSAVGQSLATGEIIEGSGERVVRFDIKRIGRDDVDLLKGAASWPAAACHNIWISAGCGITSERWCARRFKVRDGVALRSVLFCGPGVGSMPWGGQFEMDAVSFGAYR